MIRSRLANSFVLSPNIESRREARQPDMIVLHYTGMANAASACDWLCNPRSGVSCHYLVDAPGNITQMVGEEMRAWHAGVSSWGGDNDINSRSIGIEIDNPGHSAGYPDFPVAQMRAVIALCHDIVSRHDVRPRNILGHSDVAPGRKIDPGEKFAWRWLHREGIGHWVEPEAITGGAILRVGDRGPAVAELKAALAEYGYGATLDEEYNSALQTVVTAFQRHFRPAQIDGNADRSTIETLRRLCGALPR